MATGTYNGAVYNFTTQASAPGTPSSGDASLYFKTDKLPYFKNDAGTEVALATLSSGVVPTTQGGTGVSNNAASTLTISGAFGTTLTVSAPTALTLPTSGTVTALGNTTTGTGSTLVLSASPTFTGTVSAAAITASGTVTATGTPGAIRISNAGEASQYFVRGASTSVIGIDNGASIGTGAAAGDLVIRAASNNIFFTDGTGATTGRVTAAGFNGVLGATTPAAASVTTLAASSTISAKQEGSASVLSGITMTNAAGTYGANWQFDTSGNGEFWSFDNGGLGWNRVLELGKAGGASITGTLAASGAASALHFQGNGSTNTGFSANASTANNWGSATYTNNGFANLILNQGGVQYFYRAASGTAGNAITWVEMMNLSSTGASVTGTLSTTGKALVNASTNPNSGSNNLGLAVSGAIAFYGDPNFYNNLYFDTGSLNVEYIGNGYGTQVAYNADGVGDYVIYMAPNNVSGAGATATPVERFRVTNGGVTTVTGALAVSGVTTLSTASGLGNTRLDVTTTGASQIAAVLVNDDDTQATAIFLNRDTAGDNVFTQFRTEAGTGTTRGSISYNRGGGLVAYNTTSDENEKVLLGDADPEISVGILRTARLRSFYWAKDETKKPQIGEFAQERHASGFRGAVSVGGYTYDHQRRTITRRPWGVDRTAYVNHLVAGWQQHDSRLNRIEQHLGLQ